MAKPLDNGNTKSTSYADKTWVFNADTGDTSLPPIQTLLNKSNDFVYVTSSTGILDTSFSPSINAGKGSDQLIFEADATVTDSYFLNLSSFEVLKLYNGNGSSVTLDAQALDAGFKEVSGGSGNDEITFGTAYDGDPGAITPVLPINVEVDGGAGDDQISTAAGDDFIDGGSGADILTGGSGADTFSFSLGDSGKSNAPLSVDVIDDYNFNDLDVIAIDFAYNYVKLDQSDPTVTLLTFSEDFTNDNGTGNVEDDFADVREIMSIKLVGVIDSVMVNTTQVDYFIA